MYGDRVSTLGYAAYADMDLKWRDGSWAFEDYKDKTGITVMGTTG